MTEWVEHTGDVCPVPGATVVEIDLGEGATAIDKASQWAWGPGYGEEGEGRIKRYRVLGIGDVTSDKPGTGARYNGGKPAMELIPLALIAEVQAHRERHPRGVRPVVAAVYALSEIGDWQMRVGGRPHLLEAAAALDYDGLAWEECARVFDYGKRKKYAAWNWAKGMPWSVAIGCAARHLMAMIRGEADDPESGEPHRGHAMCNLVMLLWWETHYPAGDDRARVVSLGGNEKEAA